MGEREKSQGAGELRTRQPPTLGGEKKETRPVRPPKYCPTTGERDNSSHSPVFFLPCTTKPLFWGLRERKWGCVNALCPRHSPSPRHTLEKFSEPPHTAKTPDFTGFSRSQTPENKKREAALLLFDFEFWWGLTISEARLYDFRQVTLHPNAAYYSIFRVRQTVENKATDVGRHFYAELSEEKIFLLFSINRLNHSSL